VSATLPSVLRATCVQCLCCGCGASLAAPMPPRHRLWRCMRRLSSVQGGRRHGFSWAQEAGEAAAQEGNSFPPSTNCSRPAHGTLIGCGMASHTHDIIRHTQEHFSTIVASTLRSTPRSVSCAMARWGGREREKGDSCGCWYKRIRFTHLLPHTHHVHACASSGSPPRPSN
jgi:hypothetical protein